VYKISPRFLNDDEKLFEEIPMSENKAQNVVDVAEFQAFIRKHWNGLNFPMSEINEWLSTHKFEAINKKTFIAYHPEYDDDDSANIFNTADLKDPKENSDAPKKELKDDHAGK
jgi:hypothetical protein